jgi:peptidoglycan-associated lipoprotein
MEKSKLFKSVSVQIGMLALIAVFVLSGCATKKYVGEYVGEQVKPVSDRVTQTETKIGQADGQIAKLGERATADEAKISKLEGDIGKVDAKAEQALANFGKLKFERKLVIDMKEGANFELNSAKLPEEAKQAIDAFLGNVKVDNTVFLVAGHTDTSGSEDTNYELGKRRAESVGRYLVTQKKIDPLRVVTVSYGETAPLTGNDTREGRAKNRRVEILAYSEGITK